MTRAPLIMTRDRERSLNPTLPVCPRPSSPWRFQLISIHCPLTTVFSSTSTVSPAPSLHHRNAPNFLPFISLRTLPVTTEGWVCFSDLPLVTHPHSPLATCHCLLFSITSKMLLLQSFSFQAFALLPGGAWLTFLLSDSCSALVTRRCLSITYKLLQVLTPLRLSLFSCTYKLLNLQPLCFDNDPTVGGGGVPPCIVSPLVTCLPRASMGHSPLSFTTSCSKSSRICSYQEMRGGGANLNGAPHYLPGNLRRSPLVALAFLALFVAAAYEAAAAWRLFPPAPLGLSRGESVGC